MCIFFPWCPAPYRKLSLWLLWVVSNTVKAFPSLEYGWCLLMHLTTLLPGIFKNCCAAHLSLSSIARVCQRHCGCCDLLRQGCQVLMQDHSAKENCEFSVWWHSLFSSLEGRLVKILGKMAVDLFLVEKCCYINTQYQRCACVWN